MPEHREFGERRAGEIDAEIDAISGHEYERGQAVLEHQREALERIATALLDRETLDGAELEALAHDAPPRAPTGSG